MPIVSCSVQRERQSLFFSFSVFDDDENVIVDEFKESTCRCALCQCINSVYVKWENWEPETPVQHILKRHIEQM